MLGSIPLFYYGFYSTFSGQTIFDKWLYQMYNVMFTAAPIVVFALLDREFERSEFKKRPELYKIGLTNACFSWSLFWAYMVKAMLNGAILLVVVYGATDGTKLYYDGRISSFWMTG